LTTLLSLIAKAPAVLVNTNFFRLASRAASSTCRRHGHRRAQGIVIYDIPIAALDIEVIDALGGTGAAQHDSYVGTRGDKLTCDMRSQEAAGPITSFFSRLMAISHRCGPDPTIAGPVQP
jgi:hypothetical protein